MLLMLNKPFLSVRAVVTPYSEQYTIILIRDMPEIYWIYILMTTWDKL